MMAAATTTTKLRGAEVLNSLDVAKVRADFPILGREVHGKPLVFLDSAASAQKPRTVIDAMMHAYEHEYANVHRGTYLLSQVATEKYEGAREKVATFLNAPSADNIVFTRNVTEAINLVAASYGRANLRAGDEIVISQMEHHANIVPWQMLRDELGLVLKIAPMDKTGAFLLDEFEKLLGPKTAFVAVTHASNAMGTIVPIADVVRLAHDRDIPVLVDGAQGAVHGSVDVQALDVDFYAFTGHKLYGPTGIGVLYGKAEMLDAMPPYQGGGDMIETVTFEKTTFKPPPHRFEAGTPPIVEAVGLATAIDYVTDLGFDHIAAHEQALLDYATECAAEVPGLTVIGTARPKCPILSFTLDGVHSHDVGTIIDRAGVAVRTGHHCAQPLMDFFGIDATARASFGVYNTEADVDVLIAALIEVKEFFG